MGNSKSSTLSNKTSNYKCHTNFKVHIAIDFGTDGVALAYALPGRDKTIFAHKQWNSSKFHERYKPKAIVLLDENCEVLAFGRDATHMFSSYLPKIWKLCSRKEKNVHNAMQVHKRSQQEQ